MADCTSPHSGDPSLYGLPTRLSFYMLWFATIFSGWTTPTRSRLLLLECVNLLFALAAFLAVVLRTAQQVSSGISSSVGGSPGNEDENPSLLAVDVCLVLMLASGYFLTTLLPLYAWRVLTCFRPSLDLDATRWDPPVPPGSASTSTIMPDAASWMLVVGEAAFALWFFCRGVIDIPRRVAAGDREEEGEDEACEEWMFLFAKAGVRQGGTVAVMVIFLAMVLFAAFVVMLVAGRIVPVPRGLRAAGRGRERPSIKRIKLLHHMRHVANFLVASLVMLAIELTIEWNKLDGLNDVVSVAQMLPLTLSIGVFVRVLYVWKFKRGHHDDDDDDGGWHGASSRYRNQLDSGSGGSRSRGSVRRGSATSRSMGCSCGDGYGGHRCGAYGGSPVRHDGHHREHRHHQGERHVGSRANYSGGHGAAHHMRREEAHTSEPSGRRRRDVNRGVGGSRHKQDAEAAVLKDHNSPAPPSPAAAPGERPTSGERRISSQSQRSRRMSLVRVSDEE